MLQVLFSLQLFILLSSQSFALTNAEQLFTQAEQAWFAAEIPTACSLLETLAQDPDTPDSLRARALRDRARIAWRLQGDTLLADSLYCLCARLPRETHRTWIEQSRYLSESGKVIQAQTLLRSVFRESDVLKIRRDAALGLLQALAQLDQIALEDDPCAPSPLLNPQEVLLPDCLAVLEIWNSEEPGQQQLTRALRLAHLYCGAYKAACDALHSYYHLNDSNSQYNLIAPAAEAIRKLLSDYDPSRQTARDSLVYLLRQMRAFHCAAFIARSGTVADSSLDVAHYQKHCQCIRRVTENYYRSLLHSPVSEDSLLFAMEALNHDLWQNTSWSKAKEYDAFSQADHFKQSYGLEATMGVVSGKFGLMAGHAICDTSVYVSQYGRDATLGFRALDEMIVLNFHTWLWDGMASTGGWQADDFIIQVRPAYADSPIRAWRRITDASLLGERLRLISAHAASDDSLAQLKPVIYLPGLYERLRERAYQELLQSLLARDTAEEELAISFQSSYEAQLFHSSIVLHEGRHAIDAERGWWIFRPRWTSEKLEYSAKLAEVGLADNPWLALCGGIYSANIGADTGHGQANLRLMRGVLKWMKKHTDEIPGLDPSRPLLPQLDLLCTEQLRSAVVSQDRLARGHFCRLK